MNAVKKVQSVLKKIIESKKTRKLYYERQELMNVLKSINYADYRACSINPAGFGKVLDALNRNLQGELTEDIKQFWIWYYTELKTVAEGKFKVLEKTIKNYNNLIDFYNKM